MTVLLILKIRLYQYNIAVCWLCQIYRICDYTVLAFPLKLINIAKRGGGGFSVARWNLATLMAKNNPVIIFSLFSISIEISNIRNRNTALISLIKPKDKYTTTLKDKSWETQITSQKVNSNVLLDLSWGKTITLLKSGRIIATCLWLTFWEYF